MGGGDGRDPFLALRAQQNDEGCREQNFDRPMKGRRSSETNFHM